MGNELIRIEHLSKVFNGAAGRIVALDDINLTHHITNFSHLQWKFYRDPPYSYKGYFLVSSPTAARTFSCVPSKSTAVS